MQTGVFPVLSGDTHEREETMKKSLCLVLVLLVFGSFGCDEQCIHPNDDQCISRWMKGGAFPYLTCEEVEETLLTGQIFGAPQDEVDIYRLDGRDTIAMAWSSNGRVVFVSTQLPNYREFGVLVDSFLLFELLKLDPYQDAATYGCALETDITADELQDMWDNHISRLVFVCQGSGQPSELPDYSRVIYVSPPPITFHLGEFGSFTVKGSKKKEANNGNWAISTCQ